MQQMILNQNVKYILITRQYVLMKVSWFIFLKIEIKINFWNLDIDSSILSNSIDNDSEIEADENSFNYLNDMTDLEKVGYKIAFNHLESSFDIYRSNGFKHWKGKA